MLLSTHHRPNHLLLFFLILTPTLTQVPWRNCPSTPTENILLSTVSVSPWPITRGVQSTFYFEGTSRYIGLQGYARLEVVNAFSMTKIYDIDLGKSQLVEYGKKYTYGFNYTFPSFIPVGSYYVLINMIDIDKKDTFLCVMINMSF
mgnify:CR=1 FL=1